MSDSPAWTAIELLVALVEDVDDMVRRRDPGWMQRELDRAHERGMREGLQRARDHVHAALRWLQAQPADLGPMLGPTYAAWRPVGGFCCSTCPRVEVWRGRLPDGWVSHWLLEAGDMVAHCGDCWRQIERMRELREPLSHHGVKRGEPATGACGGLREREPVHVDFRTDTALTVELAEPEIVHLDLHLHGVFTCKD